MYLNVCGDPDCPNKKRVEELESQLSKIRNSLIAVGGIANIKRCLQVGNDAPLRIVVEDISYSNQVGD